MGVFVVVSRGFQFVCFQSVVAYEEISKYHPQVRTVPVFVVTPSSFTNLVFVNLAVTKVCDKLGGAFPLLSLVRGPGGAHGSFPEQQLASEPRVKRD